jgi:hypothetical protein
MLYRNLIKFLKLTGAAFLFGLISLAQGIGAAVAAIDPGAPGPLQVVGHQYGSFAPAFQPSGFPAPVEQLGVVWHPTNMGTNVYPLILFLHGKHATCYSGSTWSGAFPCPTGYQPIENYRGYDYLAQRLASQGYIVVSISANGINAMDDRLSTDGGAYARAQLVQKHLDIWRTFNNGGDPWGGIFRGRVNLNNVGTMGHSRGGEGVVRHYQLNASLGSPYGIKAVLPLAPVNFSRFVINNVNLGVVLPYCDGDVNDLSGVHYYDDSRYNLQSDTGAKHTFLVFGANHNFYNTKWTPVMGPAGAADDWVQGRAFGGPLVRGTTDAHCGSFGTGKRLTAAQQRGTAEAYLSAFFRVYVGNETAFLPYLKNEAAAPPSAQTPPNGVLVSYHPAAGQRRTINALLNANFLTQNNLGGQVGYTGLTGGICGGVSPAPSRCLPTQPQQREPHTAPTSQQPTAPGLSQLKLGWTATSAKYFNQVAPGFGDVSSFNRIQFRAGLDFTSANNRFTMQDLSVALYDTAGRRASVPVSTYSAALFFPPGLQYEAPRMTLNTVSVPLSAFSGIDLRNLSHVSLEFDRQTSGAIVMTDLMFAR